MIIDNQYEPKLPRDKSFGWQIAVLGANMSESLDKELKSIGLSINQWPTLFALWEKDGLTQTELTSRCNTAHYTTTRLLDSLEKIGVVERQPHPTSRRAHLVYLTEKGRNLEVEAVAKAQAVNAKFLSSLSKKDQEQIMSLILKMTTAPPT